MFNLNKNNKNTFLGSHKNTLTLTKKRYASKTATLLLVIDFYSSRFLDKLAHLAEIARLDKQEELDKSGLVRVLCGRDEVAVRSRCGGVIGAMRHASAMHPIVTFRMRTRCERWRMLSGMRHTGRIRDRYGTIATSKKAYSSNKSTATHDGWRWGIKGLFLHAQEYYFALVRLVAFTVN